MLTKVKQTHTVSIFIIEYKTVSSLVSVSKGTTVLTMVNLINM